MFLVDLAGYIIGNRYHDRLSRDQVRIMQQKKFTKLVNYVVEKSPYYQEIINKNHIDITHCRPEDFPILTKKEVLKHFDHIVTDPRITKAGIARFLERSKAPSERFLGKYHIIHTSGSSGTVGYSVYSAREMACGAAHFTRIHAPSIGQKLAYIGAVNGHYAGVSLAIIAKKIPLIYKQVSLFDINKPFIHTINQLNKLQPSSLGGYAFALRKLAEAQEAGELHINPKVIQSGGEPLSGADKRYIQRIFQLDIVNIYAASEHLIMGIGKDVYRGMYLMEDNLVFEQESSYTCVTNLFNMTLPLIRYQMSDRLKVITDTQKFLPFTKVANIVGRNEQVPIFLNDYGKEDFISPLLLIEFYVKGITAFQFRLVSNRKFIFKVCLDKQLSIKEKTVAINKSTQTLNYILHEKSMTKVKFHIEIVDHLWVNPTTGKFQLIIK